MLYSSGHGSNEFLEASQDVAQRCCAPAKKVEAPVEQDIVSEDDTDLKDTVGS